MSPKKIPWVEEIPIFSDENPFNKSMVKYLNGLPSTYVNKVAPGFGKRGLPDIIGIVECVPSFVENKYLTNIPADPESVVLSSTSSKNFSPGQVEFFSKTHVANATSFLYEGDEQPRLNLKGIVGVCTQFKQRALTIDQSFVFSLPAPFVAEEKKIRTKDILRMLEVIKKHNKLYISFPTLYTYDSLEDLICGGF